MTSAPAVWEVAALSVAYGRVRALTGADLAAHPGTITGIVGPNGGGKSTLLKGSLGLAPVVAGRARCFGAEPSAVRGRLAYMPQASALDLDVPATVADVVLTGTYGDLGWFRRPGPRRRAQARAALDRVGIADLAERGIAELSGGQRQRMLLARALVREPELCLLDEPFQGVDATSRRAIAEVLSQLREGGACVVLVDHDLATLRRLCDRVAFVDGTVQTVGQPAEVLDLAFGIGAEA